MKVKLASLVLLLATLGASANSLAWTRVTEVINLWQSENCSVVSVYGYSAPPEQILITGVDCPGHNRIHVKVTSGSNYCDVDSEQSGYYVAGSCENYRIYDLDD